MSLYSWNEIKKHNKENDLWIVANSIVYDATNFIKKHPGGKQAIIKKGGTDCTIDFNFHTKIGKKQWDIYKIGYVKNEYKDTCCIIV